jgi:hypothetical protein
MAELFPPRGPRSILLAPRVETLLKRARALTTASMLPPLARCRRAPPLKSTNSFLFTGLHPLYRREVIHDQHDHMKIYCNQEKRRSTDAGITGIESMSRIVFDRFGYSRCCSGKSHHFRTSSKS